MYCGNRRHEIVMKYDWLKVAVAIGHFNKHKTMDTP